MAILIKPTAEKKIIISGTSIELPQVYTRIEFGCRPNGITMEMAFYTYSDYITYASGSMLLSDIPTQNLIADIDPETQVQGLEAAHDLSKTYYTDLGYEVEIKL